MMATTAGIDAAEITREAVELTGAGDDYDRLLELVGNRRFVLLGEASHGTHEFYRERARITKRLIEEKGFTAVAVEADWPDAYRVNRYVLGQSADENAKAALADFRRFPAWMWRNTDVVRFVEWLRARNDAHHLPTKARFYGLDLYSLRASMEAVIAYLDSVDPEAAAAARARYSCFDHVRGEGPEYGHAVALKVVVPCENEVVAQLVELRQRAARLLARDGWAAEDEFFFAEQNARLVHNAERYYRAMYRGRVSSWNLRDQHMAETLEALVAHLDRQLGRARVVVWEHNSHVGDARATELGASGELNVGQLVRSRWPHDCLLVGFTTHHGRALTALTPSSCWPAARASPSNTTTRTRGSRLRRRLLLRRAAANKGLALFPRRIGGRFVALFRSDRETNTVAFSDNPRQWEAALPCQVPTRAWERLRCAPPGCTPLRPRSEDRRAAVHAAGGSPALRPLR